MFRRKLGSMILAAFILTAFAVPVHAELPSAFWALNDAYLAAQNAGDDEGIIDFGEQVIQLLTSHPLTPQAREVLASRYYDVADAYDRRNDFVTAARYYEAYIPYGEYMGWKDGVQIAKAKVLQYVPTVSAYTDAVQPQSWYGARNEPKQGILYGEVAEQSSPDASMMLLYIDYGKIPNDWEMSMLRKAQERGIAVEIAWNIQSEGSGLWDIPNQGAYVDQFFDVLQQVSPMPIFLRIGAEMNIWDNKPDPGAFQNAFLFLADKAHARLPQAATVWSVSHASQWGVNMEDFYPGDDYVDWVGISAYMIRHFQGVEWPIDQRYSEVCFNAGDAADPVLLVKETVDKFGDRKPIMLAECGSAHTTVSLNMDNTEWAITNLKRMYTYVPMVYPQVKLMAYFDTYVAPETNDYALTHNEQLKKTYEELVRQPHFIQKTPAGEPQHTYRPITQGMLLPQTQVPLYAYPHVFGDMEPQVSYYIDGILLAQSSQLPYHTMADLSEFSIGQHTLRVVVNSRGNEMAVREYPVTVTENIKVQVDGQELESDVVPVMESERTLVPMRAIFEALGAAVEWDENTRTATAIKDGSRVSLTIDQQSMNKDGKEEHLDVPARIINDRTMVPVRAVSQALGAKVDWIDHEKTVVIETAEQSQSIISRGIDAFYTVVAGIRNFFEISLRDKVLETGTF